MLRVTRRVTFYRPPDDDLLTADRHRFVKPLTANGGPDDPDEFDVRDRIPEEFTHDDRPQDAGQRAKKIEEALAQAHDYVERVDEGEP